MPGLGLDLDLGSGMPGLGLPLGAGQAVVNYQLGISHIIIGTWHTCAVEKQAFHIYRLQPCRYSRWIHPALCTAIPRQTCELVRVARTDYLTQLLLP